MIILRIFEIWFKDDILVKFLRKSFTVIIFIRVLIRRNNIYSIDRVLFIIIIKYIFNYDRIEIRI